MYSQTDVSEKQNNETVAPSVQVQDQPLLQAQDVTDHIDGLS
jgi:hypothetical protein